jgi:hypothetical protein
MELESIPELYSGLKKVRYEKALDTVIEQQVLANPDRINTTRKGFIKQEQLYKINPTKEVEVAYRLI